MFKFKIIDVVVIVFLFSFLLLRAEMVEAKKDLVVSSQEIARIIEETTNVVSYNNSPFQQPKNPMVNNTTVREIGSFDVDLTENTFLPASFVKKPKIIRLSGNVKEIIDDEILQRYAQKVGDSSRIVINAQYVNEKNKVRAGIQYTNNKDYLASNFSIQRQINEVISLHSQFRHVDEAKLVSFGIGLRTLSNFNFTGELGSEIGDIDNFRTGVRVSKNF